MDIKRLENLYAGGELTVSQLAKEYIEKIGDDPYGVFINFDPNLISERAAELDEKKASGAVLGPLFGVPVTVKDNMMTEGQLTTAGSKHLANYVPSYDAEVISKLKAADALIIGKTNMDEFAMGSTSESSYFGVTRNPIDSNLAAGGSSSGAGAGQKLGYGILSLGTDTGGSVRQPAAYCSVLGYLPSYGTISKWGVVPMAPSLDNVGLLADNFEDLAIGVNVLAGKDPKDSNTIDSQSLNLELGKESLKGAKVAYVSCEGAGYDPEVIGDYKKALEILEGQGAKLVEIEFKTRDYFTPVYMVFTGAEVSSTLSRYDGIRYGYSADDYSSLDEMYIKTRSESIGSSAKRRAVLGMYYLGENYARETYERATRVRRLIVDEMDELFERYDLVLTPSATNLPPELGAKSSYTDDFRSGDYHVLVNLTGKCALSIPLNKGLGGSVQFICDRGEDERLLSYGQEFYEEVKKNV